MKHARGLSIVIAAQLFAGCTQNLHENTHIQYTTESATSTPIDIPDHWNNIYEAPFLFPDCEQGIVQDHTTLIIPSRWHEFERSQRPQFPNDPFPVTEMYVNTAILMLEGTSVTPTCFVPPGAKQQHIAYAFMTRDKQGNRVLIQGGTIDAIVLAMCEGTPSGTILHEYVQQ